jgi:DNA-binding NarL/FixJ family response regulator
VVGKAADGAEAVTRAGGLRPDVILMDLRMPGGLDGVSAIRMLADRGIGSHVLVLTTYETDREVLDAIDAGATGYLLKDAPRNELFRAVRAAARGEAVLSPSVATRLVSQVREPLREPLSQRELDVLKQFGEPPTVRPPPACTSARPPSRPTLLHIYAKLGVNDRAAAVAEAFERGLLTPGRRSSAPLT